MSKSPNKKSLALAMKNNRNGIKLKTDDIRQEAFKQYLDHLSRGYPKEAFFFDHKTHSVCWKTMERYIQENPAEFPPHLIERAKSARYKHWLDKGITLMEGGFRNGSPVVWQTIMRNIFRAEGWDREQIAQDSKTHVQKLAESIRSETLSETEASDSEIEQAD